jgi:hypothetical protein
MKAKKSMNLVKAEGETFTEALNAATVEDLEGALRFKALPARKRERIVAALDNKRRARALQTVAKVASEVLGVPVGVVPPKGEAAGKGEKSKPMAKEKKGRRPSGLDAAVAVLAEAKKPMKTGDMVQRMISTGLWQTKGKTPAATIYAAIIREIAAKGDQSRFRKTDRATFDLTAAGKGK